MNRKACISIIIPTLNESYFLSKLLPHLLKADDEHLILEIIVADGGSTDNTCLVANLNSAKLVHCPERGRAKQMNFAAKEANGQILHFIHADAFPPQGFTTDVFLAWKAQSCGLFSFVISDKLCVSSIQFIFLPVLKPIFSEVVVKPFLLIGNCLSN